MKPVSWVGIVLKVVRHARVETVLQFTELPLSSACDITLDNPGQQWLGNPPPPPEKVDYTPVQNRLGTTWKGDGGCAIGAHSCSKLMLVTLFHVGPSPSLRRDVIFLA